MSPVLQMICGLAFASLGTIVALWGGWYAKDGFDKMKEKPGDTQQSVTNLTQVAGDGGVNAAATGPGSQVFVDNRKTDVEYKGAIRFSSKNELVGDAYETRVTVIGQPVAPVFQFAAIAPSVFQIEVTRCPGMVNVLRRGVGNGMAFIEIAQFGGEYEILLKSHKPEEYEIQTAVPE